MLSWLCYLYRGTTPDYWLDRHSFDEWQMYIAYGEENMAFEAQLIGREVGHCMAALYAGEHLPGLQRKLIVTSEDEEPDREAFHRSLEFNEQGVARRPRMDA